jgi:hypothetical protein
MEKYNIIIEETKDCSIGIKTIKRKVVEVCLQRKNFNKVILPSEEGFEDLVKRIKERYPEKFCNISSTQQVFKFSNPMPEVC